MNGAIDRARFRRSFDDGHGATFVGHLDSLRFDCFTVLPSLEPVQQVVAKSLVEVQAQPVSNLGSQADSRRVSAWLRTEATEGLLPPPFNLVILEVFEPFGDDGVDRCRVWQHVKLAKRDQPSEGLP